MVKILLYFLLLLISVSGFSQGNLLNSYFRSPYTYIYRITDEEAQRIYKRGMGKVTDLFFHTLVDSFAVGKDYSPNLAAGHYLYLHANGPSLVYTLEQSSPFQVKLLPQNKALSVLVFDHQGNGLSGASVFFNRKRIPFDAQTNSFRLNRTPGKGLLKTHYEDITAFHNLEGDIYDLYPTPILRKLIYTAPIRYAWQPVDAVVKTIKWGEPHGWLQYVHALFDASYRLDKSQRYRGYMLTNKPQYQPGDTVKFKAFVVRPDGKPLQKTLQLKLSNDQNGNKKLGAVTPYRKGSYDGHFVMHDSLQLRLDKHYSLALVTDNKHGQQVVATNLSFEDYELKENKYALRVAHDTHYQGQENKVYLSGTDANGLNLLDARVQVIVNTNQIMKSTGKQVFVPDTLWRTEQPLEASGETLISIPSDVFPAAHLKYTVTATFLNSSNERSSQSKNVTYRHTNGRLAINLLQDSLHLQYLEGEETKPMSATLTAYSEDYDELMMQELRLPACIPFNAYYYQYELKAGKIALDWELEEEEPLIQSYSSRSTDSLYYGVQNPRRLPYWYYVYRGEKLVERGQGNEQTLNKVIPIKGEQPYFVKINYMWGGALKQLQETAPHRKRALQITLDAPEVVYPGQKADFTVSLTNYRGLPVAGVDLTAYAVTSKFKSQQEVAVPSWDTYKRQKNFRQVELKEEELQGKKRLDWHQWRTRMGLDSINYYNFLYPQHGLFTHYSETRDSLTQFSPFVVASGKMEPIHIIYLNEVPVYFSKTNVPAPYSFAADSGYHAIKLRTATKLISLDSVYFYQGKKLILSVDITDPAIQATSENEKNRLSAQERNRLSAYLFSVKLNHGSDIAYLKQGNSIIRLQAGTTPHQHAYFSSVNNSATQLVGPFSPDWMQYHRLGSFMTNFQMESNHQYLFESGLLKMKALPLLPKKVLLPTWGRYNQGTAALSQEALTEASLKTEWEQNREKSLLQKILFKNQANGSGDGFGRIGWSLDSTFKMSPYLVLVYKDASPDTARIYSGDDKVLNGLKPDTYQLVLLFKNGDYIATQVTVKGNGQVQCLFHPGDLKKEDKPGKLYQKIISDRKANVRNLEEKYDQDQILQLRDRQSIGFTYIDGSSLYAHTITGQITSAADNLPLPGVTILLKNTNIGTITDAAGRYEINAPEDGILVIRFLGTIPEEVDIEGRTVIDVKLHDDVKQLSEVVVVGYGMQRKSELTGAVAGVQVKYSSMSVVVRGANTIQEASEPLLVVDGIPYSGKLSDIDPSLIISSNMLKGQAATNLYGVLAANGVLLLKTKKGANHLMADGLADNENAIRSNFSDYAFWKPRLVTDQHGKAAFPVTFPGDVTSWNTYILGMDYKKRSGIYSTTIRSFKALMATLALPRFLIEGDRTEVIGKTLNYLPDSTQINTRFEVGGKTVRKGSMLLKHSNTDTLNLIAPAFPADSLEVLYELQQADGFSDGERRVVKVYPKGIEEKEGVFLTLYPDTTLMLNFDPAKGPVRIRTQGDILEVLLEEIDQLHKYEYWCSEQAASKLKALLMEKNIRKMLGQSFKHDQAVRKLIRHLEKVQLPSGAWTWWQAGPAYPWITNHVIAALTWAKRENYSIKFNEQSLVSYLVDQLENGKGADKLTALETLYDLQSNVDYRHYVQLLEMKSQKSLEEQLRLTRMRQKLKMEAPLDTLLKYKQQTMLGGLFLGKEKITLFDNMISNTVLAYDILKAAGGHAPELLQIQAFLLSERRNGRWRNTYESAKILEALLPAILGANEGKGIPATTLNFTGPLILQASNRLIDTTFIADQPLQVKRSGTAPLFLTAYQSNWVHDPSPVANDFSIRTYFKGIAAQEVLKAGEPVELVVEVEVKADAEYVMMEVPIPAGCAYNEKRGSEINEVHREYFRNKVVIFADRLPKGKYTYTINLLPRFKGAYTFNPAKIELMYFPTFFARNGIKKLWIKN